MAHEIEMNPIKPCREKCRDDNSMASVHRASPCCIESISVSEELFAGLTPVKSIEYS